MDYCFVKTTDDTEMLTVLVAKIYPYRAVFACPCNEKGPDEYVTARFAKWILNCGITQCTYLCDQERPPCDDAADYRLSQTLW